MNIIDIHCTVAAYTPDRSTLYMEQLCSVLAPAAGAPQNCLERGKKSSHMLSLQCRGENINVKIHSLMFSTKFTLICVIFVFQCVKILSIRICRKK